MKTLSYLFGFGVALSTLFSCASIQQVADDDVYVTKNPQLTTSEEVNDVSSYENFRYRKDKDLFSTRYGRTSGLHFYPTAIIAYNAGYSPFNDPFYYPHQYGTVYGNAMYYQFGNYDTYCYSPYYNNYSGMNYYGFNCFNTNGNYYNNNNTSNGWGYTPKPTGTSYNSHYGPRNTFSGVNNYGRGSTGQKLGISKQNPSLSQSTHSGVAQKRGNMKGNAEAYTNTATRKNISSGEVKSSRPIASGSGLTRTSTKVYTASSNNRSGTTVNRSTSGSNASGSSTRSSGNWSAGSSNSSSTRTNSGGSTVRSTGNSSGGSSTPRGGGNSGSSTPVRRGGR